MKRFTVIMILLLVGIFLLSINTFSQTVVKWEKGGTNSESSFIDGAETKRIKVDGLQISASLIDRKGGILHAFISIENRGRNDFNLDRSDCSLILNGRSDSILRSKDPEELANSLIRRGDSYATISSSRNKLATQDPNREIRKPDGSITQAPGTAITRDDLNADSREAARGRREKAKFYSAASYVSLYSIRTDKLLPGNVVEGNIWFDNKDFKEAVLSLKIGDMILEFPFVRQKR